MVPNSVENLAAAHQQAIRILFDDQLPPLQRVRVIAGPFHIDFCGPGIRGLNLDAPVESLNPHALARLQLKGLSSFIDTGSRRRNVICSPNHAAESGAHAALRTPETERRRSNYQDHDNQYAFHLNSSE